MLTTALAALALLVSLAALLWCWRLARSLDVNINSVAASVCRNAEAIIDLTEAVATKAPRRASRAKLPTPAKLKVARVIPPLPEMGPDDEGRGGPPSDTKGAD